MYVFIGVFTFFTGILKRKKTIISSLILLLSIISAIRYNVGGDYSSYKWIFDTIQSGNIVDIEKGYFVLNKIIPSYSLLLFIVTFFTLYIIFLSLKIFFPKYEFFLFSMYVYLYYLQWNLGTIRQGISIAIFMLALTFLHRKKIFKYCLIILVACLFHKTSIILLPLFLLPFFSWKFLLSISSILILLKNIIMTIIFNLITHLNMNYVSYVSGSIKNSFGFQNIGFVFVGRIIMYFIFLIFLKNFKCRFTKEEKIYLKLLNKIFLCMIFLNLFLKDFGVAMRMIKYFEIFCLLSMFWIILKLFKNKKLIEVSFLFLGLFYFFNYIKISETYYPYETIFSEHLYASKEYRIHPLKYKKIRTRLEKEGFSEEEIEREFRRMGVKE